MSVEESCTFHCVPMQGVKSLLRAYVEKIARLEKNPSLTNQDQNVKPFEPERKCGGTWVALQISSVHA